MTSRITVHITIIILKNICQSLYRHMMCVYEWTCWQSKNTLFNPLYSRHRTSLIKCVSIMVYGTQLIAVTWTKYGNAVDWKEYEYEFELFTFDLTTSILRIKFTFKQPAHIIIIILIYVSIRIIRICCFTKPIICLYIYIFNKYLYILVESLFNICRYMEIFSSSKSKV